MGFWIYFGFYTFSVIVIWAFYIIAKIHALKFKNYQPKIEKATNIVTVILLVLTIIGYILIFIYAGSNDTYDIKDTSNKGKVEEQIEPFSDISEKDDIIPVNAGEDYY